MISQELRDEKQNRMAQELVLQDHKDSLMKLRTDLKEAREAQQCAVVKFNDMVSQVLNPCGASSTNCMTFQKLLCTFFLQ